MYIQVSHVYWTDLQRSCQQYLSLCCLSNCFLFLPVFMFVMVWNMSAVEWRFKSAQSFSKQVLVNDWQASKPVGQCTRQTRLETFAVVCMHVTVLCLPSLFFLRLVNLGVKERACMLFSWSVYLGCITGCYYPNLPVGERDFKLRNNGDDVDHHQY